MASCTNQYKQMNLKILLHLALITKKLQKVNAVGREA